jgi:hypothetical protein
MEKVALPTLLALSMNASIGNSISQKLAALLQLEPLSGSPKGCRIRDGYLPFTKR